jgi:excisionase family DNA binding protein
MAEKADGDALLTPAEVAALFRVNPKTVTRWARAGKLTAVKTLGGHRRFRASEIRVRLQRMDALEPESEALPPGPGALPAGHPPAFDVRAPGVGGHPSRPGSPLAELAPEERERLERELLGGMDQEDLERELRQRASASGTRS